MHLVQTRQVRVKKSGSTSISRSRSVLASYPVFLLRYHPHCTSTSSTNHDLRACTAHFHRFSFSSSLSLSQKNMRAAVSERPLSSLVGTIVFFYRQHVGSGWAYPRPSGNGSQYPIHCRLLVFCISDASPRSKIDIGVARMRLG